MNNPNYDSRNNNRQDQRQNTQPLHKTPDRIPEDKPDITSIFAPLYRSLDDDLATKTTMVLMANDGGSVFMKHLVDIVNEYDVIIKRLESVELPELYRRRQTAMFYYELMEYFYGQLPALLNPPVEEKPTKGRR